MKAKVAAVALVLLLLTFCELIQNKSSLRLILSIYCVNLNLILVNCHVYLLSKLIWRVSCDWLIEQLPRPIYAHNVAPPSEAGATTTSTASPPASPRAAPAGTATAWFSANACALRIVVTMEAIRRGPRRSPVRHRRRGRRGPDRRARKAREYAGFHCVVYVWQYSSLMHVGCCNWVFQSVIIRLQRIMRYGCWYDISML